MTNAQAAPAGREKWVAFGAVALLMTLVVRNAWVTEDAYITLRTIDHWLQGFGLRWNIGERVQAYTHPLWMLLVTLPYVVVRDAYAAALITSLAVTAAAVIALVSVARSSGHAVAAVMLLALSRSFIDYSTSGLENPLSHLLIVALVWLYAVEEAGTLAIALCAALLALNRTDTLLVALPPLAHTVWRSLHLRGFKQTLKELVIGFSPYALWELFSLFYYGFLVPNTAFAKLNTGLPRGELARQGLAYTLNAIAWDPALFLVLTVGLAIALSRRHLRTYLLVASALLYIAYVVQIGGDFMKGRFFTIPVFIAACLVAIAPLALAELGRVAALLLPVIVLFVHPSGTDLEHGYSGAEDEREFYEDTLGLMSYTRTRGVPHHMFRDIGESFAANAANDPVKESYNVGITGFFAGPRVHIVDQNALADPLLGRLPARYDPNWRIGHYTRQVPEGYLQTIKTGVCTMPDKQLCEYYERLREIIAGDLWSFSRLSTILAMNFGRYDYLLDRERYRYPNMLREPVANLTTPIPEKTFWNDPRARVLPADGIELSLGRVAHAKHVTISLDGNDSYRVEFRRGTELHGELISESQGRGMLHSRQLSTPQEAIEQGYDRIIVRPLGGDGMYSLGYVRIGL